MLLDLRNSLFLKVRETHLYKPPQTCKTCTTQGASKDSNMIESLRENASKVFCKRGKNRFLFRGRMKCHVRMAEVRVQTLLNAAEHDVGIYLLCKYSRDEVRRTVWLEREACCCPWRFLSFSTADSSLR